VTCVSSMKVEGSSRHGRLLVLAGVVAASTSIQRSQREPCLAGVAAAGVGVAGALPGGQPGPGAQPRRCGEPLDVPDLGDHGGRGHQPDPRDRQQPPHPMVAGELARSSASAWVTSTVMVDQPQAGIQPGTCGGGSWSSASQRRPAGPNRVLSSGMTPRSASSPWSWDWTRERMRTRPARVRTSRRASRAAGGAIQASASRLVRSRWAKVLGVDGVVGDPGRRDRLGGQRVGHVGRDAGSASRSANQPPAVGGLKGDLDRLGLELAEEAPELGRGVADPPRQHHLPGGIQGRPPVSAWGAGPPRPTP
jgi:hypothetical protein